MGYLNLDGYLHLNLSSSIYTLSESGESAGKMADVSGRGFIYVNFIMYAYLFIHINMYPTSERKDINYKYNEGDE